MRNWLMLGMLLLLLGGCALPFRGVIEPAPAEPVLIAPPAVYTKPETDAINAEQQCKALARNMVQIARCEARR
jgi:hypothetical protein